MNMNGRLTEIPSPSHFQEFAYDDANRHIKAVLSAFGNGEKSYYVSAERNDVATLVHKAFNEAGYDVTPIKHYPGDYRESQDWSFTISVPEISPSRDNL